LNRTLQSNFSLDGTINLSTFRLGLAVLILISKTQFINVIHLQAEPSAIVVDMV